jgi:orotate phosphoribosyltransferase
VAGEHGGVESRLIELAHPRYGHFDLGTGYHGDVWLDLDRLFLRPALLRPHVRVPADRLREHRVDAVCGPTGKGPAGGGWPSLMTPPRRRRRRSAGRWRVSL